MNEDDPKWAQLETVLRLLVSSAGSSEELEAYQAVEKYVKWIRGVAPTQIADTLRGKRNGTS